MNYTQRLLLLPEIATDCLSKNSGKPLKMESESCGITDRSDGMEVNMTDLRPPRAYSLES
jgi:hypothetical protein